MNLAPRSTRKAIKTALLELITAKCGPGADPPGPFVTIGRTHWAPPQLPTAQQPACFLPGMREIHHPRPRGAPAKIELVIFAFVYAYYNGINEPPGQETQWAEDEMDAILQSLDDALEDPSGLQTLGGLVSHCWIEGDSDVEPGVFSQQMWAIVPIHVLIP